MARCGMAGEASLRRVESRLGKVRQAWHVGTWFRIVRHGVVSARFGLLWRGRHGLSRCGRSRWRTDGLARQARLGPFWPGWSGESGLVLMVGRGSQGESFTFSKRGNQWQSIDGLQGVGSPAKHCRRKSRATHSTHSSKRTGADSLHVSWSMRRVRLMRHSIPCLSGMI